MDAFRFGLLLRTGAADSPLAGNGAVCSIVLRLSIGKSLAISVFPLCYLKQLNTQRWLSLGNQFIRIVFSKKRGARDGVTRETQFLAASRLTLASRTRRGITQMRLRSV